MTFEEWFFNYYGRGKMGTIPSGPIPPGYDPNAAVQADLGRFGKRTLDFFERTFGPKAGPKLGEPLPGERPALQMPGLTQKLSQMREMISPSAPPLVPTPPRTGSGIADAFTRMMYRTPPNDMSMRRELPVPPYQRQTYQPSLIGVPYPGVPMPVRGQIQMPVGPRSSNGEPQPVYHIPEEEEPLPTNDEPQAPMSPEVEEAIPPLLRRPWGQGNDF